jgi:hypothetical protein
MIPNNDPLYNTKQSKIQRFAPFTDNIKKERDDLAKAVGQNRDDKTSRESFPHSGQDEMHWNTITNKMDKNLSKSQIEDRIKALEDEGVVHTDRKYKIVDEKKVKSFEKFTSVYKKSSGGCEKCGCNESDSNQININPMMKDTISHKSDVSTTSYMFFQNLESMSKMCEEMLDLDHSKINSMLNDGHNWAEDHISIAKENISHVYKFISNKGISENSTNHQSYSERENYMFFSNIKSIHRMISELSEFNEQEIDTLLGDGHDWSEDHISAAKENIEQVYDWIINEFN